MIVPVILSGGAGTRLWPQSRVECPKQLLSLVTKQTLLQDTAQRLNVLTAEHSEPVVICNENHGAQIDEQLRDVGYPGARLIFEPEGRNTAPAAAVAALLAERLLPNADATLLILPADHVITEPEPFAVAVNVALGAASEGYLVSFGIVPDRPETGYGYIKRGGRQQDFYEVESFTEKPDAGRAKKYISDGDYYWNSGMFMFKAASYLSDLESFSPEILAACRGAVDGAEIQDRRVELGRDAFLACPADSIDYAVMEHTRKAAVVPLDAGWSDVGSWASLSELCDKDANDNVLIGETISIDCQGTYIRAGDRLVAAIGLENLVVVDTPDAVLIMPKNRAQDVKAVVAQLKNSTRSSD